MCKTHHSNAMLEKLNGTEWHLQVSFFLLVKTHLLLKAAYKKNVYWGFCDF